jgi:hypothetical protein
MFFYCLSILDLNVELLKGNTLKIISFICCNYTAVIPLNHYAGADYTINQSSTLVLY